jgi:hypothetical protein
MYDLRWLAEAEDELVAIWTAATDSGAIARAATQINHVLERDPVNAGESRESDTHRILFQPPLGVTFVVEPDRQIVRVTAVWLMRSK